MQKRARSERERDTNKYEFLLFESNVLVASSTSVMANV